MNERPTPNTDQEESRMRDGGCPYIVTADFARRLERQRDELMDALEYIENSGLSARHFADVARAAIAAVKEGEL